ncbi:MAG: IS256 family transposase [Chloroflexi bacterium]|nr:MAG: IS256 family transposase [Chloroflexota bacterium]
MLSIVVGDEDRSDLNLDLDAIVREGARRMLMTALRAEVDEYIGAHSGERDATDNALIVRNGVARPRKVTTAAGELEIQAPRVNDRRQGVRFTSAILPPWARRSPKVTEVLPVLYLRGISSKDFVPALAEFFGSEAGLSASTIQRLTREWSQELKEFEQRNLSQVDYVYLWADGVHFNIRLEEDRLCCLVLIGVRADGRKELVAVGDGFRESADSWAEVLRDLKRRGMRAPVLAIGDGALGFWGALREVFPETKEQRCWVHKIANCLDALPQSLQSKAKAALHEIMNAEHKEAAEAAVDRFQETYGAKYPKAVEKLLKDREVLLSHFDFPAEHWIHLRSTNAIESTFATVRLRTKKTKGAGSRAAGLAMAYKLLDAAQARWRCVNAPHLVALVRAGATFVDGIKVEREDQRYAA